MRGVDRRLREVSRSQTPGTEPCKPVINPTVINLDFILGQGEVLWVFKEETEMIRFMF